MSISSSDGRSAVSLDELRRAWGAVQAGQFRRHRGSGALDRPRFAPWVGDDAATTGWTPRAGEQVLPVIGCSGSCGASTLAVALATAAGRSARVVECASVTATGLAAAATAELGTEESGWVRGTRGQVLLERSSDVLVRVDEVPAPPLSQPGMDLTVLDVGWELGQVLSAPSWLGAQVRAASVVVLVARATVPGLRRLEGALALLPDTDVCAAVVGTRRKKWPTHVLQSVGPLTSALDGTGRLVVVPEDRHLAVAGLDTAPIPEPLLTAAAAVLELTGTGNTTPEGTRG